MSAPPYMKLYVADYLADTTHLTTAEHGAYLLLLMALWRAGGKLPNVPLKLARITKSTTEEWEVVGPAVLGFFTVRGGALTHKRVREEIAKYDRVVKASKTAGKASRSKRTNEHNGLASKTVQRNFNQPEPEPEPEKGNKDIPLLIGGLKNERRPDLRRIATDNRRGAWAGAIAERNGSAGHGNEVEPGGYGVGDSGGEGDRPVTHSRKARGGRAGN